MLYGRAPCRIILSRHVRSFAVSELEICRAISKESLQSGTGLYNPYKAIDKVRKTSSSLKHKSFSSLDPFLVITYTRQTNKAVQKRHVTASALGLGNRAQSCANLLNFITKVFVQIFTDESYSMPFYYSQHILYTLSHCGALLRYVGAHVTSD